MSRRIAYWGTTVIVATMLLGSLSYLTGNEQVVSGFAKAGYPQHLRIVLVGEGTQRHVRRHHDRPRLAWIHETRAR